jgi:hypothetical protein
MISAKAKRRIAIRNGEIDPTSNDNFIINYEPTIEIIEKDGRTKIEAENRGQAILDEASISEVEHSVED